MKFFHECNTIEEVKARYKKLAKENHLDLGGNTATMQAINKEYAFACALLAKGAGLSADETEHEIQLSQRYREAIEKIIHLQGIVIEVVGHWIWVTGNTKPIKEALKSANYFFASKKIAWYFRTDDFKCRGGKKTLEQIRAKYGSETINSKYNKNVLTH